MAGDASGGGPRLSVGVAVVTHRAREHLARCLPPLLASPLRPRVLVVNSSSGDGTVEEALRLGAEILVVPRNEFNHGLTRELARRKVDADVVAMLTPDAYPTDKGFLERLTAPVRAGDAAVSYGRQVAREGADLVERFGREFNYPAISSTRALDDWSRHGSYTHFCSNACAAWSSAELDAIGGFRPTLVSEETIAAAELLRRGRKIAYVAEAVVVHSHRHGLADEFARHFDIGYTRERFRPLLRWRRGTRPGRPVREGAPGAGLARGARLPAARDGALGREVAGLPRRPARALAAAGRGAAPERAGLLLGHPGRAGRRPAPARPRWRGGG
jgi:rhamnosyltransferase